MLNLRSAIVIGLCLCLSGAFAGADDDRVLATVNGTPITAADLELQLVFFRPDLREDPAVREQFLERLIQQALITQWLDERRVEVDEDAVEARVELLERILEDRGQSLEEVLKQFGRTIESLREEQALPVRWSSYARSVITQDQIAEYFDQHRRQLDGTKLRVSHIVITLNAEDPIEDWNAAEARLRAVRDEIASGSNTFADAARTYSDSPTADEGGDVGFINFRGDIANDVSDAAFLLEVGELSEPIRSPFGVHLVQVTDRQPGQLSLEDVRDRIIERLADDLQASEVARLKESASIERLVDEP